MLPDDSLAFIVLRIPSLHIAINDGVSNALIQYGSTYLSSSLPSRKTVSCTSENPPETGLLSANTDMVVATVRGFLGVAAGLAF
jgi:hypothetical protein